MNEENVEMKVEEVVKGTCDKKRETEDKFIGFCNTGNGPKSIEMDKKDLEKSVNSKTINQLDAKYGFDGQLVEAANTALKQRGSKGIFH